MAFTNSADITIRRQVEVFRDLPTSASRAPRLSAGTRTWRREVHEDVPAAFKVDVTDLHPYGGRVHRGRRARLQQGIKGLSARASPRCPRGQGRDPGRQGGGDDPGTVKVSFTATWDRDDLISGLRPLLDDETTPVATEKISDTPLGPQEPQSEDTTCSPGDHTLPPGGLDPSWQHHHRPDPTSRSSRRRRTTRRSGVAVKPAAEA